MSMTFDPSHKPHIRSRSHMPSSSIPPPLRSPPFLLLLLLLVQMFQSALLSRVLDTLRRSPVLPAEPSCCSGLVLKNLACLLDMADEHLNLPLHICVKVGTTTRLLLLGLTTLSLSRCCRWVAELIAWYGCDLLRACKPSTCWAIRTARRCGPR